MSRRSFASRLFLPVSDRDHFAGRLDAPVTLLEYGDYECPYCAMVHVVITELQARFRDRLCFVFRNFPLTSIHPHAEHAAEAAEEAAVHKKFWEMHDLLFENRESLGDEDLVGYAATVGLEASRFRRELQGHTHAARVHEDFVGGARSGVSGTPTFFINGIRHEGEYDLESLRTALQIAGGW